MTTAKPGAKSKTPPTHVALLRGINVGGNRLIPMKALTSIFESAGCKSVVTYIQSGNVVFAASAPLAKALSADLPKRIGKAFGFEPVVVIRSRAEFVKIKKDNPFFTPSIDPATLHVGFLADKPTAKQIAALDPDRSPGDAFAVRGKQIYLHLPNGVARTRLTSAYLDSTLGTTCTTRNWRTVTTLGTMLNAGY